MHRSIILVATTLATFALAYASLLSPKGDATITPIWLPNAFILAVLLASKRSAWLERALGPGLAIVLANLLAGFDPTLAFGLAACNIAECLGAATLSARWVGRNPELSRAATVAKYSAVSAVAATASALAATVVIWVGTGTLNIDDAIIWALADFSGLLVVTPSLLALWLDRRAAHELLRRDALMLAGLFGVTAAVFLQHRYPLLFLVPSALSLIALRSRLAVVSAGLLGCLLIAAVCTIAGTGPFALIDGSIEERILGLQLFLAVTFMVSLPITAQSERERSLKRDLANALAAALDESRKVKMAQAVAQMGYWRHDLRTGEMSWSPELYQLMERDPAERLTLESARETIHPDDREQRVAHFDAWVRGEVAFDQSVYRMVTGTGSIKYVRGRAIIEHGDDGEALAVFGVIQDNTDLVLAEQEKQVAEERYRLMAENVQDIFVRADLTGRLTYISPACRRLGYEPEDLIGSDGIDLLHPDDVERYQANAAQLFRDGLAVDYANRRHRYRCKDGSYRWLEGRPSFVRDGYGNPVEIVNVFRDITEQIAIEEELTRSEEAYRRLADNSGDIIAAFDLDTNFTYVSAAVERILGYKPEELVGKSTKTIMTEEDFARSVVEYREHLASGRPDHHFNFEYQGVRKDGSRVWLLGSPRAIYDQQSGKLIGFQDIVRDISERHAMEAALAESESRFRLFAENAADLVMETAIDGRITYVSPSCLAITGYEPSEVLGKRALDWLHPDDAPGLIEVFQAQVQGKGRVAPRTYEFRMATKDGWEIWMEAQPKAKLDPETGAVIGVTDVARDITERKRFEADLEAARAEAEAATQVKSEFLANMSHELRTPLTSIVGFTRMMAEQQDLSPLTRNFVDRIENASRALLSVVNDVLDFSKLEAGQITFKPEPTNLLGLMRSSLELFQPQAGAKDVDLVLDSTVPETLAVAVDPDRMRQVLLNLIGNAVKFTAKGSVTLGVHYDDDKQLMRVAVQDTGPGIDDEGRSRLFQRFSQVDGSMSRGHGGTGLGLAICKGIVEAMRGEIGVTSEVGRGSCFWFEVPAARVEMAGGVEGGDAAFIASGGIRVLVVDDHAANRELATLFLEGVGAEVQVASDGEEAVSLAAAWPFDVILMDMRMPKLDGPEALRIIRAKGGPNVSTPILAFTAEAGAETADHLTRLGFQSMVTKPIDPEALYRAVAQATAISEFEPSETLGQDSDRPRSHQHS